MDPVQIKKADLEKKLVDQALLEFEQGKIKESDLSEIAKYIIQNLKPISGDADLQKFLEDISLKWPFFNQLVIIEQGEVKDNVEESIYSKVLELTRDGKINEAIQLSKSITNG